jgi:putative Mg2+ transporter-C (MgtC) family protein
MTLTPEDLVKILMAVVAGGLIGVEREFCDKAAGFRTMIFICLGASLFTIFSAGLAGDRDPTRIAASIVTGVGFLGAGVILRDGGKIMGLTTAATIWLTAAVGMGLGGGYYLLSWSAVGLILIILWFFPHIEQRIDNIQEQRTYQISGPISAGRFSKLEKLFNEHGCKVFGRSQVKACGDMLATWQVSGPPAAHERICQALMDDPQVHEFRV